MRLLNTVSLFKLFLVLSAERSPWRLSGFQPQKRYTVAREDVAKFKVLMSSMGEFPNDVRNLTDAVFPEPGDDALSVK